jgi:hypothetical protein
MNTTDKPIGAELRAALLPAVEPLFDDDQPLGDKVLRLLNYLSEEVAHLGAENERLREHNEKLRIAILGLVDRRFSN